MAAPLLRAQGLDEKHSLEVPALSSNAKKNGPSLSVWPSERGADRPARATCHAQVPGDMKSADFPQLVVSKAISTFGHVDCLVRADRTPPTRARESKHTVAVAHCS